MSFLDFNTHVLIPPNPEDGGLKLAKVMLKTPVVVPNVVGMSLATATAALTAVNLGVGKFGNLAGIVASQSPAAATLVQQTFTVNVKLT